jgi:hypothetical protein
MEALSSSETVEYRQNAMRRNSLHGCESLKSYRILLNMIHFYAIEPVSKMLINIQFSVEECIC